MKSEQEAKVIAQTAAKVAVEASWPHTRVVLRVITITLLVAAVLWILFKLTGVILLLILSIFFAYLVSPLVEFIRRPVRLAGRTLAVPRVAAIALAYVLVFSAVIIAIYFLVPRLGDQFPEFAQQARTYGKSIGASTQRLNDYFKQHRVPDAAVEAINKTVPRVAELAGESVSTVLTSMVGWLAYIPWLILIPLLSFFLLKDVETFRRSALQMLPRGRWRWRGDEFFQDINSTLAAYTRAQLTACLFIGAVCAVGFSLLGLPSPLVLGLIAGLFEFVPLLGPLLIALFAALMAAVHSGFTSAVIVLVFLVVLRIIQDYIVYPRLIGHGVHLHPLAVVIAILSGAELAGVAGVFLAIPAVAILTVSYRNWLEHRGSEGLAEVLQEDLLQDSKEPGSGGSDLFTLGESKDPRATARPTSQTTADEMVRARPDLTTGALKVRLKE